MDTRRRGGTRSNARGGARSGRRGQALVEFSLTIGILLLLFLAVVDFGRMVAMHSAAVTASREAARFGSSVGELSPGVKRYQSCDAIRDAARTVTGAMVALPDSNILVSYDSGPSTAVAATCPSTTGTTIPAASVDSLDRVVVEVRLTYSAISPLGMLVGPIQVVSVDKRTIVLAP